MDAPRSTSANHDRINTSGPVPLKLQKRVCTLRRERRGGGGDEGGERDAIFLYFIYIFFFIFYIQMISLDIVKNQTDSAKYYSP